MKEALTMLKKYLVLLLAVLLVCLCAGAGAQTELPSELIHIEESAFEGDASLTGLVILPDTVETIGERAFASTGIYALEVQYNCESIGADLLAGSGATYVYVPGRYTTIESGALSGAAYAFVNPYNEAVAELSNYVSDYDLYSYDNVYYRDNGDNTVDALCLYDPGYQVYWYGDTLTIPKLIWDMPVVDVSGLVLSNCPEVTTVRIPSYLDLPSIPGKTIVHYDALTVTVPQADGMLELDTPAVFSVTVSEVYGDVTYNWTITNGTEVSETTTTEPTVTATPTHEDFSITVEVTDAIGDTASATATYSLAFDESVAYRALLIGNTYPGEYSALDGPDNDAYAMRKMLAMWPRTAYNSTVRINVTTNDMISSISSAFAAADSNDVSLFFYSGHGTPDGSLCGTSNTFLSVGELRDCLDRIPGTKIVMLDCCYSGAHINKGEEASASDFNNAVIRAFSAMPKGDLATNGYIVLTASSKDQESSSLSYVGSDFWFGAFTYGVCLGSGYDMVDDIACTAWADSNSDNKITLYECYTDTVDTVKNVLGCDQNTQYYGSSDFVLWSK